jgi:hypothetical protein
MAMERSTSRVVALIVLSVACGCASPSTRPAQSGPPASPSPPVTARPATGDLLEERMPFAFVTEQAETADCKAAFARVNRVWAQSSACERDSDCEKSYGQGCAAARGGRAREELQTVVSETMKTCKGSSLMVFVCDEGATPVCVDRQCRMKRRRHE